MSPRVPILVPRAFYISLSFAPNEGHHSSVSSEKSMKLLLNPHTTSVPPHLLVNRETIDRLTLNSF